MPSVLDASLSRRAIMLILACLRTSGVLKVISDIPKKDRYNLDLFTKLGRFNCMDEVLNIFTSTIEGFMPITETPTEEQEEITYLTRRY